MGSRVSWEMCKFHILSTKDCEARLLIYFLVISKEETPNLGNNRLMEQRLSWHKNYSWGMLSSFMMVEKNPSVNILPDSPFPPSQRSVRTRAEHILLALPPAALTKSSWITSEVWVPTRSPSKQTFWTLKTLCNLYTLPGLYKLLLS